MSKFHDYSLNNTLLIASQKPEATLVAGYTAWQKQFGRQVQKGEKGIRILAPAPYKQKMMMTKIDPLTQQPVLDANGDPVKEEKEITRSAFKVVNVFDVSQTQGREIPSLGVDELTGDVSGYETLFEALKRSCPVPMDWEAIRGGAKGYYHQAEHRIALLEGMSEQQTIKTAIHEMTHQRLHAENPEEPSREQSAQTRNSREVEAESVAYTICQHFGIDTSDYSFAYIVSWSQGKDTPELKESLLTIRKTASEMIGEIEEQLAEIRKERETEISVEDAVQQQIHGNPAFSKEQVDFMTEMAEQNCDLTSFPVGGSTMDLTAKPLTAEEIADIRYQMDADAIPKMLYTKEQWQLIESGIKDRLNVRLYADPKYSPEQMDMIKRTLVAESFGYLSEQDVKTIADPSRTAQEMKDMIQAVGRDRLHMKETVRDARELTAGLQDPGTKTEVKDKVAPDRNTKPSQKKSVLADLRAKQAMLAEVKTPVRVQKQKEENQL